MVQSEFLHDLAWDPKEKSCYLDYLFCQWFQSFI